MGEIFDKLREAAITKTNDWPDENFVVRGFWKTELIFKPNPNERAFHYNTILAQVMGQGCCYCASDLELEENKVGMDARELIDGSCCTGIAVLDAIYSSIPKSPAATHEIRGNSIEKTHLRNNIIADEVERLCDCDERDGIHLLNVGVVGDLVKKLRERNFKVTATDLDESIIDRTYGGVTIEHGERTMEYVEKSDLAIISGMTLSTDTLEEIVERAKANETLLLMFAETGANFGEEYVNHFGIDTVVSEPYPFYIFQGVSTIDIYRGESDGG